MKISFERMFSKGNKQKSRDHGTANMANLKVEESKRERVLREMHEESGNYPDVSAYNIEWRRRREAQPIAEDYEGAIALVEELQEAARNEPALKAALYKLGRASWQTFILVVDILSYIFPTKEEISYTGLGTPYIDTSDPLGEKIERGLTDAKKRLRDLQKEADKKAREIPPSVSEQINTPNSYGQKSRILENMGWTGFAFVKEGITASSEGAKDTLDSLLAEGSELRRKIGPGREGQEITIISREDLVPGFLHRSWYFKNGTVIPPDGMYKERVVVRFTRGKWEILNREKKQ